MKITEVRTFLTCPGRNYVLVKILTDEGVYGVGEGSMNSSEPAETENASRLPSGDQTWLTLPAPLWISLGSPPSASAMNSSCGSTMAGRPDPLANSVGVGSAVGEGRTTAGDGVGLGAGEEPQS